MEALLKNLIRAESTINSGETAAAGVLKDFLADRGIDAHIDCWGDHRANIVVHIGSSGHKKALFIAAHLDVVDPGQAQWRYPPFEGCEHDGRIYGRGAADMKGPIAAVMAAITEILQAGHKLNGDFIFLGAAGEETDSSGAKRFMRDITGKLPPPAGVVICEPTDFDIVTAHRGMLWLRITTKGKTAHGSMPHLGINAIGKMKKMLDVLESYSIRAPQHPLLGTNSISLNTIHGGKSINVVPDECAITLDIRTLPGQSHDLIIADLKNKLDDIKMHDDDFDARIDIVRSVEAMETDTASSFVCEFCETVGISDTKAVDFTTDGPHFVPLGVPIVIFGPGKSHLCHQPDEYIEIADLQKGCEYYKHIISRFLF